MLAVAFSALLFLAQFNPMLRGAMPPDDSPRAAATAPMAVAASQPKGLSAQRHDAQDFDDLEFIKVLKGEKRLSPQELLQLGFWVNTAKDLVVGLLLAIPKAFVALVFLIIFYLIYRTIRKVIVGSMGRANVDQSIRDMLGHLLKWGILGFGLVIAFNQIGIQITALLTGVSIIGLAIGFAAQETLSNFIAGIVIFWDRPFKVGDWIEVEGTHGQVQRVTFRSTRILNLNGEVVIFPNTHMLSHRLSNHSTNPINRVNVPIGIAYKESIDDARAALLALTRDDPRIRTAPAPQVIVKSCGESSVDLVLRFWIEDEAIEWSIGHEFMEKAKKALDAAGIQIPFPHMQLFLEQTPAVASLADRRAG